MAFGAKVSSKKVPLELKPDYRHKSRNKTLCDKSLSRTGLGVNNYSTAHSHYTYKIEEVTHNFAPEESSDSYKLPERKGNSYNFLQTAKGLGGQRDRRPTFLSELDRVKVKMLVVSPQASLNNSMLPSISRRVSPQIHDYSPADQSSTFYGRPKMNNDSRRCIGRPAADPRIAFKAKLMTNHF